MNAAHKCKLKLVAVAVLIASAGFVATGSKPALAITSSSPAYGVLAVVGDPFVTQDVMRAFGDTVIASGNDYQASGLLQQAAAIGDTTIKLTFAPQNGDTDGTSDNKCCSRIRRGHQHPHHHPSSDRSQSSTTRPLAHEPHRLDHKPHQRTYHHWTFLHRSVIVQRMMSRPEQPSPQEPETIDLSEVISRLHINVDLNGNIHVNGIPETLPNQIAEQLTAVASAAAQSWLEKIRRTRSTLTRDDRRLLTKVARTALRNTLLRDIHAA